MDRRKYYNLTLREAARQFEVGEDEVRHLVHRGALDARFVDGQWWVHLGPRRGEATLARLWHGTSKDRADVIVEHGFWPETLGKQIWFTTRELSARLHAIGRAQQRRSVPFLFECEVDLNMYSIFWRRSALIYVFHQPIGSEVIKSVQEINARPSGQCGDHEEFRPSGDSILDQQLPGGQWSGVCWIE